MKEARKFLIYILIFYVSFFLIAFLNQERIENFIEEKIKDGGYFFVFFFSFLMDVLDQPIGPEVPGIIGVLFNLDYLIVFLFCAIGSLIGSLFSFSFGKYVLSSKIGILCKSKKYNKHCKTFKRYGNISLLIASLTPVPYVLFCWLSGAFKMKLINFFIYGIIPRTIRIFLVLIAIKFFL
ncbi:MAG: hypothetical protein QT05_C0018G0004 [archaeon GW2011_AR13]|nr:MAG: hypothetical protein QT05_C0018G0004 [archaeon GW2011_AR13]HIG94615.1 DedA family protein [Nanoarchaeota archaeon]HIH63354.1 DedA family protein [Nanoarchaeota archaeon]HIJ09978.1 DedA family protein [Nanoarchaeota archaeon]